MSTASPCERTMVWLREQGYTVDKVEQRMPFGQVTRDFLGFADILAVVVPLHGVVAVQATTSEHLMERVAKVQAEPRAAVWLACHNRIWVVGWGLRGEQGTRKVWVPRVVQFGASLEYWNEQGKAEASTK